LQFAPGNHALIELEHCPAISRNQGTNCGPFPLRSSIKLAANWKSARQTPTVRQPTPLECNVRMLPDSPPAWPCSDASNQRPDTPWVRFPVSRRTSLVAGDPAFSVHRRSQPSSTVPRLPEIGPLCLCPASSGASWDDVRQPVSLTRRHATPTAWSEHQARTISPVTVDGTAAQRCGDGGLPGGEVRPGARCVTG